MTRKDEGKKTYTKVIARSAPQREGMLIRGIGPASLTHVRQEKQEGGPRSPDELVLVERLEQYAVRNGDNLKNMLASQTFQEVLADMGKTEADLALSQAIEGIGRIAAGYRSALGNAASSPASYQSQMESVRARTAQAAEQVRGAYAIIVEEMGADRQGNDAIGVGVRSLVDLKTMLESLTVSLRTPDQAADASKNSGGGKGFRL